MAVVFTRFKFTVTYRPGSKNIKADALSRQHESFHQQQSDEFIISPTLILAPVQWDILTELTEAQMSDPPPPDCPPDKTYVPPPLRKKVTQHVHSSLSFSHPGITATLQLLTNRFWWPSMQKDTISFVQK